MSDEPAAAVTVELPPALVRLFPGSVGRLELNAATVSGVFDALNARWPGMRDRLADTTPRIRRNIIVFVEGKRASLETEVPPGAAVVIRTGMIG